MRTARSALEAALNDPNFAEIASLPNLVADLRYGSKQNLLGCDVYEGFQRVLLHREAAEKLKVAAAALARAHPELKLVVFDALRPQAAQLAFWDLVKGTPQQPYFADPEKGSIHSYGFAVDLGLLGEDGRELDMGTGFDDLTELAEPRREAEFLASGRLHVAQLENRRLLRNAMEGAGFRQLPSEWWHYDALPPAEVRARYARVE